MKSIDYQQNKPGVQMLMPCRCVGPFAVRLEISGNKIVGQQAGEMLPASGRFPIGIDCVKSSKIDKKQPETFPFFGRKSLRSYFLLSSPDIKYEHRNYFMADCLLLPSRYCTNNINRKEKIKKGKKEGLR
jgi:hypothetical protein